MGELLRGRVVEGAAQLVRVMVVASCPSGGQIDLKRQVRGCGARPRWRYSSSGCHPVGRGHEERRQRLAGSLKRTQGLIVVPKALDWNGPSGWYSQTCTSRADQSLRSTKPKIHLPTPARS